MVRARKPLIAFGVATLVLAACGSDDDKGSSSSSSSTSVTTVTVPTGVTTTLTTVPGAGTAVTVSPVTAATTAPTVAGATTTTAAGSTSTTVKGRTNVTSPSDNVKLGDKGDGVKQSQTALKAAGYKVTVDGDFGNQTDAAVRQFQKKNGLKVDGVVGKITWGKLSTAGTSTSSSSAATTTTAG
jgi:peptidoglycan hydrolase-like protein with peptidoglycan-binding domain